jgi:hypothetical protein
MCNLLLSNELIAIDKFKWLWVDKIRFFFMKFRLKLISWKNSHILINSISNKFIIFHMTWNFLLKSFRSILIFYCAHGWKFFFYFVSWLCRRLFLQLLLLLFLLFLLFLLLLRSLLLLTLNNLLLIILVMILFRLIFILVHLLFILCWYLFPIFF